MATRLLILSFLHHHGRRGPVGEVKKTTRYLSIEQWRREEERKGDESD